MRLTSVYADLHRTGPGQCNTKAAAPSLGGNRSVSNGFSRVQQLLSQFRAGRSVRIIPARSPESGELDAAFGRRSGGCGPLHGTGVDSSLVPLLSDPERVESRLWNPFRVQALAPGSGGGVRSADLPPAILFLAFGEAGVVAGPISE